MASTERKPILGNPKNQANEALYTKGGEFELDGKPYIGYYHIYGVGVFTEGQHTRDSRPLRPLISKEKSKYIFETAAAFKPIISVTPSFYKLEPREVDYSTGFVFRFFAQKVVKQDSIVYELSERDYTETIQGNFLDTGLYNIIRINWKLTGPLRSQIQRIRISENLLEDNEIIGIVDYNRREVKQALNTIPGLESAITNYAEFARPSNFIPNVEIKSNDVVVERLSTEIDEKFQRALRRR